MTTLTDRSHALVERIDAVSKLPVLLRATKAEALVREAADILFELSTRLDRVEKLTEIHSEAILKGDRDYLIVNFYRAESGLGPI